MKNKFEVRITFEVLQKLLRIEGSGSLLYVEPNNRHGVVTFVLYDETKTVAEAYPPQAVDITTRNLKDYYPDLADESKEEEKPKPDDTRRKVERWQIIMDNEVPKASWIETTLDRLRTGDVFRMTEPDGTLCSDENGKTVFEATEDGRIDENGVGSISADAVDIPNLEGDK